MDIDATAKTTDVLIPPTEKRFLIELEFVQNLCNIKYLQKLAEQRYLEDESFIEFLRYLRYWKRSEYAHHLLFPQCLAFLDALIENENFRRLLQFPHFIEYCHKQQGMEWNFGS